MLLFKFLLWSYFLALSFMTCNISIYISRQTNNVVNFYYRWKIVSRSYFWFSWLFSITILISFQIVFFIIEKVAKLYCLDTGFTINIYYLQCLISVYFIVWTNNIHCLELLNIKKEEKIVLGGIMYQKLFLLWRCSCICCGVLL